MRHEITRKIPTFEPVHVELVFERLSELQDFELRMMLYKKNLIQAAQAQLPLNRSGMAIAGWTDPVGIGKLRDNLHELLGADSVILSEG